MGKLPAITQLGGYGSQTVTFRGLNRTEGASDGEFTDMENLACYHYPAMGTRKGRVPISSYDAPSDLFEWDGHLVVVDGSVLYYDGRAVSNVEPGKKQFAVVNTKLIVWPDGIEIDLTNGTWTRMDGKVSTFEGTAVFSGSTLTAQVQPVYREGVTVARFGGSVSEWCPIVYTYGTDTSTIAWDAESGWTLPEATIKGCVWDGSYFDRTVTACENGDIFIPKVSGSNTFSMQTGYCSASAATNEPDETLNTLGLYGVWRKWGGEISLDSGASSWVIADIYQVGVENALFSISLREGDRVTITGADNEDNNVLLARIESIDDEANALTFADVTFTDETATGTITICRDIPAFSFLCSRGNRLYGVSNAAENRIYNSETGEFETFTSRCIYVSALGLPDRFWDFDGVDADSYQVAVASNGDFTGCCSYSGDTLLWKEDMLYRLYGDYPSNFGLYEYNIPGVQAGSARSQRIINEVLYYKGRDGVYAYSGSTPSLVSYNLGYRRYSEATAGADGVHYHISMKDEDGAFDFYTYDTVHGLWMREDGGEVKAFSLQDGTLYAIIGTELFALETDSMELGGETVRGDSPEWYAEFPAFDEQTLSRKEYKWIRIRVRLEGVSGVAVLASLDGAEMVSIDSAVHTGEGAVWKTLSVPLPINRVDRMVIRLQGVGKVQLHEFSREFIYGSEEA